MREATRLTQAGRLNEATEIIQRALRGKSQAEAAPGHADAAENLLLTNPLPRRYSVTADPETFSPNVPATIPSATTAGGNWTAELHPRPRSNPIDVDAEVDTSPGEFANGSHTHAALTRRFKLYMPPGHASRALPLVVMLHGCTQDADDFAAGTGMNALAREQGFFVLYPAQSQDANPSRCWNWFQQSHQQRGSGEPALIASLAQAVIAQHGIDARRVYIAGLSAGGAMAAIVAAAYPDIFAAVGVHSGLPPGAAGNVMEALAAMKSAAAGSGLQARSSAVRGALDPSQVSVPTIVFHGDQDKTVHPRNGDQVIAAVLESATGAGKDNAYAGGNLQTEIGVSALGRRYTRTIHRDVNNSAIAEHWLLHGAGHAWSGGLAGGSYTDAKGPDATGEMLRFFLAHPHRLNG